MREDVRTVKAKQTACGVGDGMLGESGAKINAGPREFQNRWLQLHADVMPAVRCATLLRRLRLCSRSMLPRSLQFPLVLGSIAVLAACVRTPESRTGLEIHPLPMPTMTRTAVAPRAEPNDEEVTVNLFRAARSGNGAETGRVLASIDDSARRVRLAQAVARQLAAEDLPRAAAWAIEIPSGQAQVAAIEVVAQAWTGSDPAAALRWAHGITNPAAARLARMAVVQPLVVRDPRDAVAQVLGLPEGAARDETLIVTASAWARTNADAALGWARNLPENELKPRVLSAVAFEIAQRQPARAAAIADLLPPGRNRWLLFSSIAQTWVAVDSKAALAWAGKLPAGEARDAAYAGVNTGLGVPASRRLAGAPGTRSGSSRTRGGIGAVPAWADGNSAEFAAWLATQAPGMSRDEAILEYVRQRGALQPDAVGQWLGTLPGGPTRDRAMEIYLEGLLLGSPRDAARWLRSLPRSDQTDQLIERTTRHWLRTNPDAADVWLQDPTLPGYLRDRLLRDAGR